MEDKIFLEYFHKIKRVYEDRYICEMEKLARVKEILEEIYKLGYQQCETDISNDDRYSLREDFEKGNI